MDKFRFSAGRISKQFWKKQKYSVQAYLRGTGSNRSRKNTLNNNNSENFPPLPGSADDKKFPEISNRKIMSGLKCVLDQIAEQESQLKSLEEKNDELRTKLERADQSKTDLKKKNKGNSNL